MKRGFFLVVLSVFLAGFAACSSHRLNLVNPKDGMTIHGTYHVASDRIEVRLPSGDLLKGQSVSLQEGVPLFYQDDASLHDGAPGINKVYAILTDEKGTMMEAVFHYNRWNGHGIGTAKTNRGEVYKIIF